MSFSQHFFLSHLHGTHSRYTEAPSSLTIFWAVFPLSRGLHVKGLLLIRACGSASLFLSRVHQLQTCVSVSYVHSPGAARSLTYRFLVACQMIILNNAAPSRSALGTLNGELNSTPFKLGGSHANKVSRWKGLGQMMSSLMKAVGPATASAIFALSIRLGGAVGGNLIWIAMALLAVLGMWTGVLLG
jgi:hypothetical protein